jgi:hypothetical protein
MNRDLDIPKASPASAARGIFDGLEKGEEDIFPDPASQSIAEGWRTGTVKALERQYAAFVQESAPKSWLFSAVPNVFVSADTNPGADR